MNTITTHITLTDGNDYDDAPELELTCEAERHGWYRPATLEEPEEWPEIEIYDVRVHAGPSLGPTMNPVELDPAQYCETTLQDFAVRQMDECEGLY